MTSFKYKLSSYFSLAAVTVCLSGCMIFKATPKVPSPQMILVEGGTFLMGDDMEQNNNDALPVHSVTLDDFYIGKYEVTFEEFDAFAIAIGRPLPEDDSLGRGSRAVVKVNWYDAKAYCEFFGFRLPTENEWEYAARSGGQKTLYSGTSNPDSLKYYSILETRHSFNVGSKKPNALGIYDMSGNVFEWIGAYYQFYETPEAWSDLENSRIRIIRGGAFRGNYSKVFYRVGQLSDNKYNDIGFRCAVSANEY